MISSGGLLAAILFQALLSMLDVPGRGYVSLILGAAALLAFGVSALEVTRMLSAVRLATEHLIELAGPSSRQARAREVEGQDLVDRLLALPARIAERMDTTTSEVERLREVDAVTGLGNRWWLQLRGRQEFARASRENRPISMIVIRVNRLERMEAEFGQQAANAALLSVADILRDFVRPYDLVGRVAADEFGLILPGAELRDATEIASRLQRAIASRSMAAIGDTRVSASVAMVEKQAGDSWFDAVFERGNEELARDAQDR
jgi:diguanylate cyclase (GGDEF)-like protein